jgi:hypothetical protein
MHSTSNLEDGYIGSGKRLWLSIRKHGKENHEMIILEWFPNRSSLKDREKQLVNEELLQDSMCMNLALGGGGIQYGTKLTDEIKTNISIGGKNRWKLEESRIEQSVRLKNAWKKRKSEGLKPIVRKSLSEETKEKIRVGNKLSGKNRSGEFNSRSKTYIFTDPDGKEHVIKGGRNNFCKTFNLSVKKMLKILNTDLDYMGWKIRVD